MNIKAYFDKLKIFSLAEKLMILKYSIGSILADKIPNGLRFFYHLSQDLKNQNIEVSSHKESATFNYPINKTSFSFSLKRNSSDAFVFDQIILKDEYKTVIELANQNKLKLNTIVDAGANIGLTTLYLKSFFPEAQVVLLEPESETFKRLNRNLEINSIKNVHPLQNGLWFEEDVLSIDRTFRDSEDWSVRLVKSEKNSNSIETKTINSLIKQFDLQTIDLLKIDIEGAEKEVFLNDSEVESWLSKVKIIALEIHDETDSRKEIESLLMQNGFELSHSGELTIGINKKLVE